MRRILPLWTTVVIFLLAVDVSAGLFADQVGKFDWSRKLVGCPKQVLFDKSSSGKADQLLVLSEDGVVASINADSGAIKWRHFQETTGFSSGFVVAQRTLVTSAQNGKILRSWGVLNGQMKWEVRLSATTSENVLLGQSETNVYALVGNTLYAVAVSSGENLWKIDLDNAKWLAVGVLNDGGVAILSSDSIVFISTSGSIEKVSRHKLMTDSLSCSYETQTESFVCYGASGVTFLNVQDGKSTLLNTNNIKESEAFTVSRAGYVITASSSAISIYDTKTDKALYKGTVRRLGSSTVSRLVVMADGAENLSILIIGTDCQMDAVNINLKSKGQAEVLPEWTRYEALAYISTVEMIDLPLSEAEANIETEFSMTDGNAWHAFTQRLISQFDQVRRMVTDFANEFMTIINSSNIKSFSSVLASVRGKGLVHPSDSFERDYFNMRKLIVATTLKGSVYGIDNSDGAVRWVLNIGNDFEALKSAVTSEQRVPLLIQRGTAHYKYASQAVIATNSRFTQQGCIFVFNPISGMISEKVQLDSSLRRIELLPFHTEEMIHPVVAFGENSEIIVVPTITTVPDGVSEIHMIWVEENGLIRGTKLDVLKKVLIPTWQSDLGLSKEDKIVAVAGKSPNQKVHSQGRVLGDRSVLYKYANPNLVAVSAVDSIHNVLSISLIDAVTGQVVYLSRHTKAAEPFNIVHCENWLAYTFWNERARRMDLGVMELFDGSEQCDSERFNSLTPRKNLPVVTEQAYVFSQGISAMAVTDTEKGLTTRSLLIAMPFGGLFEVSRRFVDARRPVEMTPEMREEMLVPYMPEILIATEDMINYNQSIHNVRNIKTIPSGLESTSLVFAYGGDLFYTRTTPSGTFDILKDDFDHLFICAVLIGSVVGSIVLRRLARLSSLKQAWV